MSHELEKLALHQTFEELLEANDEAGLREFLNNQNISLVVDLIYEHPEQEMLIMNFLATHRAVSVFKILDVAEQKRIVQNMHPHKMAVLLNELPPDDRTDFLEELPNEAIRDLIKVLNPEERKVTLSLLGYPEDSVGRMMTPDYVYVYPHNTIDEAFETIRRYARNSETIDVIYVINERGELIDDLRIKDLFLASPNKRIEDITDGRVIALNVTDDQEIAQQIFKMNNRVAIPVTDNHNVLLGIVTIDDMLWVAGEESTEDMQKMGGTEALDEPYLDIPLFRLLRKRVGWLVVLFIGEMFTATAMGYFEHEIEKATVLALFVPLIISSGGNSGSQASTLIIQAMALGEITIAEWWRVMRREIVSGFLLGCVLGIIGFARIILWHTFSPDLYGEHYMMIALVVGLSLVGVVLWGSLSGSMLPILLKKLGADPATSSAPFVATLVDVTGLVIYFSVAYLLLRGLLL
jgi:magnesium transporter